MRCKNDPRHSYLAAAGKCPWCELIAVARLMFFLPGQGAATQFRPEDIDQLIRKLAGMQITFAAYVRPRPVIPVQVSLPPGLAFDHEAVTASHPAPPRRSRSQPLAPLSPPPNLLPKPPLKPLPPAPTDSPRTSAQTPSAGPSRAS